MAASQRLPVTQVQMLQVGRESGHNLLGIEHGKELMNGPVFQRATGMPAVMRGTLDAVKKSKRREENPTVEQFAQLNALVGEWVTIPDIAEAMEVIVTRVHTLVDDGAVLAFKNPQDGVRRVPIEFTDHKRPLDSLKGTISVLRDAGFSDVEAAIWLLEPDDSLPGRPIDFLHQGRKTEIRRRAQALAW